MATNRMNHNSADDAMPLTPEEMKAIGEIELGPSRHEKFLNQHYKKLIFGTIAIMVLSSAAIVYGTWRAHRNAEAAAAAIAAMKVPTGGVESVDYDATRLGNIVQSYTGTQAAATAQLLRGMQMVDAGEDQAGLALLEQVAASAPEDFLRLRARVFLAGYYMRGGDTAKAVDLWLAVSQAGASPYQALALLSLGDLAKQARDEEQARTYYNQLIEACPSSPLMLVARNRIILLGVDAPVPVEAAPAQPASEQPKSTDPGSETLDLGPLSV